MVNIVLELNGLIMKKKNNMKKILLILVIVFTMISCMKKGDYKYLIYMKNGEIVKAYHVHTTDGGNLYVRPPYQTRGSYNAIGNYYLSSSSFIKAEYVGTFNIKEDER